MQVISPQLHRVHNRGKNKLNAKKIVLLPLPQPVSRSTKSLGEERDENISQEYF